MFYTYRHASPAAALELQEEINTQPKSCSSVPTASLRKHFSSLKGEDHVVTGNTIHIFSVLKGSTHS